MPSSFGSTCGARARKAAILSLLGLLLSTIPVSAAYGATSSSSVSTAVPLSLGFSPSSLSPVSGGVPVYTVGDTVWADSGYSSSTPVTLTSAGGQVVATKVLDPGAIAPLYSFTAKDTDGIWNITLDAAQGKVVVPIRFVNLADYQVALQPFAYSIDGGSLAVSTQANLGDSYDQEICAAGTTSLAIALPSDMHDTGNVTLSPGSSLGLTVYGQVNESFSFWFELYHPYSLEVTSANSLVVDNLLAAQSQTATVAPTPFTNSTEKVSSTVTWNTPLRQGRYDMRAYFQNSTGNLDAVQLSVLVLNASSWVSLSSTCLPETVQSPNISYSASLTGGAATWPRTIYFMYRTFGVEAVESYHVDANLSSVNFVASPWNQTLQDVQVNVTPGPRILSSGQAGSSLFILSSGYPTEVDYSLDIGGSQPLSQGSVTLHASDATTTQQLDLSRLTVSVLNAMGSPSTLKVAGPQGLSITTDLSGANQTSSFLLPAGSYTVSASQGPNTQSAQVSLADGVASSLALNFSTFVTLETILIVTAIIAAIVNVAVWLFRSRSLVSRMKAK